MESEGDEGTHQHPKRSKPTKPAQFPKDSNPRLPQELITEILVRLPVKYLLQYKSVSKDWLSLISSPDFVKTHLSFSAKDYTRHRVMLKKYSNGYGLRHCSVSSLFNESVTHSFDLDYPLKPKEIGHIVGSVNGLICLCFGFDGLVLWNPLTGKFKQVTSVMLYAKTHRAMYGFGYDEVHDDYKIVGIFYNIKNVFFDAKIYSLRRGSWRSLDDFPGREQIYFPGKFVNGKLHWFISGTSRSIISVALVDEICGKVEQPSYREGDFGLNLGVIGSDLSVLCNYHRDYRVTHADVWVMREYGVKESWTIMYTITYPDDPNVLSMPIYMSNKGEILLLPRSNLTIYNAEDDTFRHPEITDVDGRLEAELYIESLVSPILQTEPMMQFEGNKNSS